MQQTILTKSHYSLTNFELECQQYEHQNMEHLLESTKYTDLTLMCAGRSIPAHRAIICPQSGFFDAACSGKFLVSGNGKKTW
jgi:hypothetical protein